MIKKLLGMLLLMSASAQQLPIVVNPTPAQHYFRRTVVSRYPEALIKADGTNILNSETLWNGKSILTLSNAYLVVKSRDTLFLLEPLTNARVQLPKTPFPTRENIVVINDKLWLQGRKVLIP
jgi:hypothetical protein